MKLSKLIAQAQEIIANHGDLDVLENGGYAPVDCIELVEVLSDDEFPKDWNLPKGCKFCLVEHD